jgi:hypothetical protein
MSNKVVYADGSIRYYNEANQLHNELGAALIMPDGYKEYWRDGKKYVPKKYLNILTRCTRLENLEAIAECLAYRTPNIEWWVLFYKGEAEAAKPYLDNIDYAEPWVFKSKIKRDDNKEAFGIDLLNDLVEPNGEVTYIYVLDDDNLIHPDFLDTWGQIVPNKKAYVFNQALPNGDTRIAAPENMEVGKVDMGQVVIHASLLKKNNYFSLGYTGDGITFEALHKSDPEEFEFINETVTYYNRLKW